MSQILKLATRRYRPSTGHVTVVKGDGVEVVKLPSDFGSRIAKNANVAIKKAKKKGKFATPKVDDSTPSKFRAPEMSKFGKLFIPQGVAAKARSLAFTGMLIGADTNQRDMVRRQYDSIIDDFVGKQLIIGKQAQAYVPEKLKGAVADHNRQLEELNTALAKAVPEALHQLQTDNPDVPVGALLQHVVEELQKQLAGLLSVLGLYTMAWLQYGDADIARMLKVLNFYMGSQFRLYQTGDFEGNGKNGIPTTSFSVGDVIVSALAGEGLGTIPGTKGPVKVHLLLVPLDMVGVMMNAMPLNSHESWHQVHGDTKGLAQDMIGAIKTELSARMKPSTDFYDVAGKKVPSLDVLTRFYITTIGETSSDSMGGVLSTGPAFGYAMLQSFPALSIRDGLIRDAKQWLRTTSVFSLKIDGQRMQLDFEVHPQDHIRAHMVAYALDKIGFPAQAQEIRNTADEAVNGMPTEYKWRDRSGKTKVVIAIPAKDMLDAAKIVVDALLDTKFASIANGNGPQAITNIVKWNAKMQAKAEAIRDALLRGESKLPAEIGTVHPTYIAAGNAMAMWLMAQQVDEAKDEMPAFAVTLAKNTMTMYEECEARLVA